MSEETAKMDETLQKFLECVTRVLEQHKLALERLAENQKIDHANIAQLTEQTNLHTGILQSLDAEVRRRMGEPPLEPPREPVN
jgi:hypothetical protein